MFKQMLSTSAENVWARKHRRWLGVAEIIQKSVS